MPPHRDAAPERTAPSSERGDGPDARAALRALFDAALSRVQAETTVPPHLPSPPRGRTVVVGAGKAAAAMARAVERHWPGPIGGLVVTRYGHGVPCDRIEVVEAAHPVPDEAGLAAAGRIAGLVSGLGGDDLVLCLLSGGASALLTQPAPGLTLADKQAVNRALLRSGAPIDAMNCVRKHLSALKGGRLAALAQPARVVSLIVSDVPGDDPAIIGSGPTTPDPTTRQEAIAILAQYGIEPAAAVRAHLADPRSESPKPGDPLFARVENWVVARPMDALLAAAERARSLGLQPLILGDALEGEAREVGRALAGVALSVHRHALPVAPPAVLLSGGETTVTVRGQGRGGRNTEFLLGLALALRGARGVYALACDTDGIDGSEDAAGAIAGPDSLARAAALNIDPAAALAGNDSHAIWAALGDLVVTGPTLTNVNDFRAILIEA